MIIKQSIITLVKQLIKKFDKAIWKILTGLRFFSTAAAAATNNFHVASLYRIAVEILALSVQYSR